MPWTVNSVPANIKDLPPTRKRQWVNIANQALKDGKTDGEAIKLANGVVKKQLGHPTAAASKDLNLEITDLAGQKSYVSMYDRQLSQEAAGYDPYGASGGSGCATCRWFAAPESCIMVRGTIVPTGKSSRYEALSEATDLTDWQMGVMGDDEPQPGFVDRLLTAIGLKQKPIQEPEVEMPALSLKELPDGRLRFLTLATNNYEDREGQYFPAVAHEEYLEWAEKENGYPELWPWHMAGGRLGVVDWMAFDGNFLLSSGLIDVGMEAKAKAWAEDPETAMSHGFFKRQVGKDIVQYREFEQSVLPRWAAANPFTDFTVGVKEMALTPQKRAALKEKHYTDEEIAALESYTDTFRTKLEAAGVSFKDLDDTPVGDLPAAGASDPPAGDPPATAGDSPAPTGGFSLDDLRTVVREEIAAATKEITGKVEGLEVDVKGLKEDEGDKLARLWESRRGAPPASRQPETVVAGSKEGGSEPDKATQWVNGIPIFQHPIFGMGGMGQNSGANGEVK